MKWQWHYHHHAHWGIEYKAENYRAYRSRCTKTIVAIIIFMLIHRWQVA